MSLVDAERELRDSITKEGKDLGRHMQALTLLSNGGEASMRSCPCCGRSMDMGAETGARGTTAGGRRARRTTGKRRASRGRARTSSNGQSSADPSNRILELVMEGMDTGPKIAAGADVHYRTALRHLEELASAGAIMREGQRQHTRWLPTDKAATMLRERATATT